MYSIYLLLQCFYLKGLIIYSFGWRSEYTFFGSALLILALYANFGYWKFLVDDEATGNGVNLDVISIQ